MPRFQFSVKWLMIAVTAVAVFLFLAVTFGGFIEMLFASVVWCILPTPLVVFAIYGRDDLQAFATGALIPWVFLLALQFSPGISLFAATIWLLPMCGICGALAAATWRWIDRNRD